MNLLDLVDDVGGGPYWTEVDHRGQVEDILDQRLGMVLRGRVEDCDAFGHV